MFIQTEATLDPETLRFLPGEQVLPSGTASFLNAEESARSPLAKRLLGIEGVSGVILDPDSITITKDADKDWRLLKGLILGGIMEHFTSGIPVLLQEEGTSTTEGTAEDDEVVAKIKELITTRIVPTVAQDGGDIKFHTYRDGIVYAEMQGSAFGRADAIANMLRHYVPEISAVRDYREALPKPGLETPEAMLIQKILDEQINPAVAAHGGHISLVDVQNDTAYIRLEGGCQGCGMADVTLKQGVETTIKQALSQIVAVLDVTDHAGGTNPYYQPGGK